MSQTKIPLPRSRGGEKGTEREVREALPVLRAVLLSKKIYVE